MTIKISPADRIGPSRTSGGGGKLARLLVYGLVVPVTLLCLGTAVVYIVTGEDPMDLLDDMAGAAHISMPMPPRAGPEQADSSLLHPPPRANDPDVKMDKEEAKPTEPAKTEASKPEEPKAEAAKPEAAPAEQPAAKDGPTVAGTPAAPPIQEPLIPPGGDPLASPSFAKLPARAEQKPLPAGPLAELLRNSPSGPLPIVAAGKESRSAYARPFTGDAAMPRIAVIMVGLGLSREATEAAIGKLPSDVTLSFSPYAANLEGWMKRARNAGHEVMMDLPLEPPNFPTRDGGPLSILTSQTPLEVSTHLEGVLGKGTSYVGLAGALRSPVSSSEQWIPLLHAIRSRGLLYTGDGLVGVAEADVPPSATVTLVADETPFRAAIDVRLARLLAAAQRDQSAVAYVSPRPVTMERLLAWFDTFPQRGVVLAPASAVVRPQAATAASPPAPPGAAHHE